MEILYRILELFKDKIGIVMFILGIIGLVVLGVDVTNLDYSRPDIWIVLGVVYIAGLMAAYYSIINKIKDIDISSTQADIAKAMSVVLDYVQKNNEHSKKVLDTITVVSNKIDGIPNKSLLLEMLIVRTKSMLIDFLELLLDFNPDSVNTPDSMKRAVYVLNSGISKVKKDYMKYVGNTVGEFLTVEVQTDIDQIISNSQTKFVELVSNNTSSVFMRLYEITKLVRELEDTIIPIYSKNLQISINAKESS